MIANAPYKTFQLKHIHTPRFEPDWYVYRDDGKFPWLQRRLFWVLRKLGCQGFWTQETHFKTVTIEHAKVADAIRHQLFEALSRNEQPDKVYIGQPLVRELLGEIEDVHRYTMPVDIYRRIPNGRNGASTIHTVFGLEVVAHPWSEGICVTVK